MRTRLIKNIVSEKKRNYKISLTVAWRLYFLETIVKKIAESKSDNVVFGGDLIDEMLYGGNMADAIELYLDHMALNKFNISRWFKEIFKGTNWVIEDIKLLSSSGIRKYKIEILCQEKDWEQVISMKIIQKKEAFPKSVMTKFDGLYYNNFLIRTYSINDLVADSFIKFMFFDNMNSLEKIGNIYKKIILNEADVRESLERLFLYYEKVIDKDELRLKMDKLVNDLNLKNGWEKKNNVTWEEMMVLIEGIIKLL